MRAPDRPYSLYEGVGGMCCAWTEVLVRTDPALDVPLRVSAGRGMPGYNDLRLSERVGMLLSVFFSREWHLEGWQV